MTAATIWMLKGRCWNTQVSSDSLRQINSEKLLCSFCNFGKKSQTNDDLMNMYNMAVCLSPTHLKSNCLRHTKRKQVRRGVTHSTVKSGEHIWIAAPAASCQLLSLAGGEESNGIYTSRQKSRGRQRFFSKLNKSPG